METVVLPANRVERATRVMTMRYRVASIVMLVTAVVLLGSGVASQFISRPFGVSDSVTMFLLLVIAPVGFGLMIRRRAKRMAWIGSQAAADATIMWLIDDHRILATDEFGTPRPELAFKITPLLRRELLDVATAALRG